MGKDQGNVPIASASVEEEVLQVAFVVERKGTTNDFGRARVS